MPKPICFMVMPFSSKETGLGPDETGPKLVDFDALWDRALSPAIEACGYTAVRADQDAGALIIVEMIQRLALSDLVVADISIGNANVYYEIGVRHTAQRYGCVLISANWARVLFDIKQMPRVVYTMNEGAITQQTASVIRDQVKTGIEGMKNGESPVFQAVPGFPDAARDDNRITQFKSDMEQVNRFLGRVRGIRRMVDAATQKAAALALREEIANSQAMSDGVAIEMMDLMRDCAGWDVMMSWIDAMPEHLRTRPSIQEQRLLAVSKSGNPTEAIGALEQLIETAGDSSERQGLLGGRYKKLYTSVSKDDPNRAVYLNRAIEHYERGMMLDLNDYYPTCNLPRLYRERGAEADADRARFAGAIALKACERAQGLNSADDWLPPTLLGAAFDAQDVRGAKEMAQKVMRDSPGTWKLETTIADLRVSTAQAQDPDVAAGLAETFNQLNEMLPEAQRLEPLSPLVSGRDAGKPAKAKKAKKPKKPKGKKPKTKSEKPGRHKEKEKKSKKKPKKGKR